MKVSVILPTYNESGNIVPLMENILSVLKAETCEIVVVDDNSPDRTGRIALDFSKTHSQVKVIVRKKERGLATAFKRGIRESTGDILVFMDTDFSHNPVFIPQMLKKLAVCDAVFMSRYIPGGKMRTKGFSEQVQYVLSTFLNYFIKAILGIRILDSTNGFFSIKRKKLMLANLDRAFTGYGDFCFKLIYCLKRKGVRMRELPFVYEERRHGKSKTNILRQGVRYILEALRLRLC